MKAWTFSVASVGSLPPSLPAESLSGDREEGRAGPGQARGWVGSCISGTSGPLLTEGRAGAWRGRRRGLHELGSGRVTRQTRARIQAKEKQKSLDAALPRGEEAGKAAREVACCVSLAIAMISLNRSAQGGWGWQA